MIGYLNGYRPIDPVADALRPLSGLAWKASATPGIIAYLPAYRGNPYQSLLYSALPGFGMYATAMTDAQQALSLAKAVQHSSVDLVVHVHWLNAVTGRTRDEATAWEAAQLFVEDLSKIRDQDARVLWTVHNVLPHDSKFPEVDAELRRSVTRLADRIHVMSPRTRELATPWFEIPEEKLLLVPHPSYDGVYPSWMSRAQARLELGIPTDAIAFLLIGAIKPYKGLTEILDAFDQLTQSEPGRFVLIVAGQPDGAEETQDFCRWSLLHPAVLSSFRKIPADEMQIYLRAADVATFPYRRSLNSGALSLALTFGLPVVLPAHSGEAAVLDGDYMEVYDASRPLGLMEALSNAQRLAVPAARQAAGAAARQVAVSTISRRFAADLRTWLDRS